MRWGTGFLNKQRIQRKRRSRRLLLLGGILAIVLCGLVLQWLLQSWQSGPKGPAPEAISLSPDIENLSSFEAL